MHKLVICDDEGKITVVPIIRDEISIGRHDGNAVRLTDRNVSRQHARLYRNPAGDFFVVGLSRDARIKVENQEVGREPHPVRSGDQIYIGDYKLSVRPDSISTIPLGTTEKGSVAADIGKVSSFARLVMLKGPEPGREYELTANLYVIGRSTEANLNIEDASISRAHARIDKDEKRWTISDLDSINGIQVNGIRKDDYLLKSGDVIELGKVQFRFVAAGEPFTYAPPSTLPPPSPVAKVVRPKMLIIAALWLALLVVLLVLKFHVFSPDNGKADAESGGADNAAALIAEGRAAMEAQNWEEAARLFAEAQMRNQGDETARELKKKANKELISQAALSASMEAEVALNFQGAIDEMVKIPVDSFYYDIGRTRKIAAKLCDELLYKADFMITAESPEARQVLDQLGAVPEISEECRANRNRLLKLLTSPEI